MRGVNEQERELDAAIRNGDLGRAALLARALGNPRYAAQLFTEAKHPYQAAVCFYEAGDAPKALASFLTLPKDDARYRAACIHALRIAAELNRLTKDLDLFIAEFAADEPRDIHEVRALYRLGILYQANELFDHARAVLVPVVRLDPDNADARQRLAIIEGLVKGSPGVYETLLRRDAASWRPPRRTATEDVVSEQRVPSLGGPVDTQSSWSIGADAAINGTLLSAREPNLPPPAEASKGGDLARGTVVAHRYRIEAELGRGGMAIVYRAVDLELDEEVALKVFAQPLDEHGLIHRFKQELTLCRQLAHPNIVRLYDIGAHLGRKFISMELLEGGSLREALVKGLTLTRSLDLLRQACLGLGAAHALGMVHRDVKPDNLFVTTANVLKLTDFGLAKKQDEQENLTAIGFVAGSPGYMAPEQITDFGSVTPRADLYSLGVVAYELCTGEKPFVHKDLKRVLEMQLTKEVPAPSKKNPRVPVALDALILRLLRKDPAERFQSCAELYERLETITIKK